MTRTRSLIAVAAAALALSACSDSTRPRVPKSIQLDQQAISIESGATAVVTATVLDEDGSPFTTVPQNVTIAWTSSQTGVATVDNGTITGLAAGTTNVTASAPGLTPASVQVTVTPRTFTSQLSFAYSGHQTGTFSVNSTFQVGLLGPDASEWAVTFFDPDYGSQDIFVIRVRPDNLFDWVWFWSFGPPVTAAGARVVHEGFVAFGVTFDVEEWEVAYEITGGTIQFAAPAQGNLSGTFALNAEEEETGAALAITNGIFDVPILPATDILGSSMGSLRSPHDGSLEPLINRARARLRQR